MSATMRQLILSLPGDDPSPGSPPAFVTPALHGLIETTSNFGNGPGADWGAGDCARIAAVLIMPATTGSPRPAIPPAARTSFFASLSQAEIVLVMMASILFRRFAPVTPDTHGNGGSMQSSQILRM